MFSPFEKFWFPPEKYGSGGVPGGNVELYFGTEYGPKNDAPKPTLLTKRNGNAFIIGRPGSGLTSLLNTVVTQLITEYSPHNLGLYMLDCSGTCFLEFVGARYLIPHAQEIVSNADVNVQMSALNKIYDMCKRRSGATANGGQCLPGAVVVIINEWRRLLDNDAPWNESKLAEAIYLGNQAGVHFVLATQNEDRLPTEEMLSHFAVRVALNCSPSTSKAVIGTAAAAFAPCPVGYVWVCDCINDPDYHTRCLRTPFVEDARLWDRDSLNKKIRAGSAPKHAKTILETISELYAGFKGESVPWIR